MNKFIVISLVGLVICTIIMLLVVTPMIRHDPANGINVFLLCVVAAFWLVSLVGLVYHSIKSCQSRNNE